MYIAIAKTKLLSSISCLKWTKKFR